MLKCKFVHEPPIAELPEGFFYIPQDNYYLADLNAPAAVKYLYTDGATSCIILVVAGEDRQHNPLVAAAHLSSPARFKRFFQLAAQHFCGAADVFAQGANPPDADAAKTNTGMLLRWLRAHLPHSSAGFTGWYLSQVTLALGAGHPQEDNRGCAGIDLTTCTVSTQSYLLTEEQRDPTGGVQTLFSIFGLALMPPLALHNAREAFRPKQVERLVAQARAYNWTALLDLPPAQVLAMSSSTPDAEPPWFYATLRTAALYVKK